MIGELLNRIDLLLQEVCLEKVAEVFVFMATGNAVNLEQTLFKMNPLVLKVLIDYLNEYCLYRIDISLQLQCGFHCLLCRSPFWSRWPLDVLQHHSSASFVLILQKDHCVLTFIGRRAFEESLQAGQCDVVTIEIISL